jgi:CheY-like chemotaxis protein
MLAQDAPDQDEALRAAGATLVIRKPVTATALVEALGGLLAPSSRAAAPDGDETKAIATA